MFSHVRPAIRKFIAVLSAVVGCNSSEEHCFIGFKGSFPQFALYLIPTQPAGQDLVWTLYQIMFRIPTY
jgi:hypothetical protein